MDSQWCPMTNSACRDDCAWADVVVTMTEDGMERDIFCSVAMIAAALVDYMREECSDGRRP